MSLLIQLDTRPNDRPTVGRARPTERRGTLFSRSGGEHQSSELRVAGSNPAARTKKQPQTWLFFILVLLTVWSFYAINTGLLLEA